MLATCNRVELYAERGRVPRRRRRCHGAARAAHRRRPRRADPAPLRALRGPRRPPPVLRRLRARLHGRRRERRSSARSGTRCAPRRTAARSGRVLNELFQQALRVGKRAHTETGIDRAGASLVGVGLDWPRRRSAAWPAAARWSSGAGSMSALSAADPAAGTACGESSSPTGPPTAPSSSPPRSTARRSRSTASLDAMAGVDLVVSCTGAVGTVITADAGRRARRPRRSDRPLVRARPRPAARRRPRRSGRCQASSSSICARLAEVLARRAAWRSTSMRCARSSPTRSPPSSAGRGPRASRRPSSRCARMAADVVAAELARLDGRLPDLDASSRDEIAQTVRRVVDKLLHAPTVRVKQLADDARRRRVRATRCASCSTSTTRRSSSVRHRPKPRRSHDGCTRARTAGTAARHPAQRARPRPGRAGRRRASPRSTGRPVELVEITTYGDPSPRGARRRSAAPASSSARCATRCSPATSTSPSTRSRTCRPRRPEDLVLAAVPPREDPRDVLVARDG